MTLSGKCRISKIVSKLWCVVIEVWRHSCTTRKAERHWSVKPSWLHTSLQWVCCL